MNRKIKSVSFNLDDPMEFEMYEYTLKYSGFSTLVKRLIQNYMNDGTVKPSFKKETSHSIPIDKPKIGKDLMSQFI